MTVKSFRLTNAEGEGKANKKRSNLTNWIIEISRVRHGARSVLEKRRTEKNWVSGINKQESPGEGPQDKREEMEESEAVKIVSGTCVKGL